jgi:hypothetical protein
MQLRCAGQTNQHAPVQILDSTEHVKRIAPWQPLAAGRDKLLVCKMVKAGLQFSQMISTTPKPMTGGNLQINRFLGRWPPGLKWQTMTQKVVLQFRLLAALLRTATRTQPVRLRRSAFGQPYLISRARQVRNKKRTSSR